MKTLKLNSLSQNKIKKEDIDSIKGGSCGCSCLYANSGGSSTNSNANANRGGGLFSKMNYRVDWGEGWERVPGGVPRDSDLD